MSVYRMSYRRCHLCFRSIPWQVNKLSSKYLLFSFQMPPLQYCELASVWNAEDETKIVENSSCTLKNYFILYSFNIAFMSSSSLSEATTCSNFCQMLSLKIIYKNLEIWLLQSCVLSGKNNLNKFTSTVKCQIMPWN